MPPASSPTAARSPALHVVHDRPGRESSSSVDLRARPSVCGADKAGAGGDRRRADGSSGGRKGLRGRLESQNSQPRGPAVKASKPAGPCTAEAESCLACVELSPQVDLAAEEEVDDTHATNSVAVAATPPPQGPLVTRGAVAVAVAAVSVPSGGVTTQKTPPQQGRIGQQAALKLPKQNWMQHAPLGRTVCPAGAHSMPGCTDCLACTTLPKRHM